MMDDQKKEDIQKNEEQKSEKEQQKKWTDAFKAKNIENNIDNDIVNKLTEENALLKDKLLRTLAEAENTRRICEEEKSKTIKFAISNIAKDLINIMDNFYLAFDNLKNNKSNLESFLKGIELNFNELKKVFEKNNIKRIYPLNEEFNPAFHEAISQVESDKDSGIVVEVLQAGYLLNGRVLKPALVVVSK